VLVESSVTVEYLAERAGEPFYPSTPAKRASARLMAEVQPFQNYFRFLKLRDDPEKLAEEVKSFEAAVESFEPFFEPDECIADPVCQGSVVSLGDGRVVAAGPGNAQAREDTTVYVSRAAAGGRQRGASVAPLGFSKLGLVGKGAGGYTDVVALGASPDGVERVGVLWELGFQGGASYSVVNVPSASETDFVDPEDPWAALVM